MKSNLLKTSWGFKYRGLVGGLLLAPAIALVVFSKPQIVQGSWLSLSADLLGWIAFFTGSLMRFWSTLYIGGRKRHTLIDDGPYSVCRNPLYLGSFLLALSVGLFLKSFVFAVGLAAMVLIYVMTTVPAEEKDLREILGAAYEDYCRRVPRFWPRFALFHTEALVEVKMHFVWVEVKRMFVWVWLPIFGELIGFLRGQTWWPCFVPFSLS